MYKNLEDIINAIKGVAKSRISSIVLKSKETLPKEFGKQIEDGIIYGDQSSCIVKENGISFHINILEGQKTGFFLDQRNNRKLVGEFILVVLVCTP